jgi:crotonobetainyl-CoA:carnitine CoA-transferase CaiB-like acyl-CoA transferase
MLSGYRALDLTDKRGLLCGKILADLGAEVIKIEPPRGDAGRNIGPFFQDNPHREKSLYWFAFNVGKKGITLNIEAEGGREIFKKLVKTADFVIESFSPGYMGSLGLGYNDLIKTKPDIIMTSITPFGQTGPYKNYKAPDIVLMAMGGSMYVSGEPGRSPLRFSFPLAYLHAASEATVGTLIACYHRGISGEGQHVDQSGQQSILGTLHNTLETWDVLKQKIMRTGNSWAMRPPPFAGTKMQFACKDGYVTFPIIAGMVGARFYPPLIEWMESDGICIDLVKNIKWETLDEIDFPKEIRDQFAEVLQQFFVRHTKKELYEEAAKRRLLLYPVSTMEDIIEDSQLESRNFWEDIEHPELGTIISYPRPCAKLLEPTLRKRSRPPRIGEHNLEIYEQLLGFSREELAILGGEGVI